jgi:uncharacterized protein (TIGR03435 family)
MDNDAINPVNPALPRHLWSIYNGGMRLFAVLALLVANVFAQKAFEVASIKPATAPKSGESRGSSTTPSGINWQSSLLRCVAVAYGVRDHQVSGPVWLADARFEIVAKAPAGSGEADFPEMMRTLLAVRFQLKAHTEPKEYSGFALVVGKDGPKLTRSAPPPGGRGSLGGYPQVSRIRLQGGGGGNVEYKDISMELLARNLTNLIGRPVLDETGLTGRYDIELEYTAFDSANGTGIRVVGGAAPPPEAEPGDSLFTSIQKLGLKLKSRQVAGEVVIVDRIEKTPTEN